MPIKSNLVHHETPSKCGAQTKYQTPRIKTSQLFLALKSKATGTEIHQLPISPPHSCSLSNATGCASASVTPDGFIHAIRRTGGAWNPATLLSRTRWSGSSSGSRRRPIPARPPAPAASFGTTPPGPPTPSSGSASSPSPPSSAAGSLGWCGYGSRAAGSPVRPPTPSLPVPSWSPGVVPWGVSPVGADALSNLVFVLSRCFCLAAEILDPMAVLIYWKDFDLSFSL